MSEGAAVPAGRHADDTLALCAHLIEAADRTAVLRGLARLLGVQDVLVFLRDPALGVLLPAPGLKQTISGGPTWRVFLRGCTTPGRREGTVEVPKGHSRPVLALVAEQATAVLLGGSPRPEVVDSVEALLPLLGWGLGGEQRAQIARADAAEARESADRAHALAQGLEAARAELARLNGELREEQRRKDEFLAMLAHELRNPLAPLATSIELLRRGGLEPPQLVRQLDVMTRQTAQLTQLVDDLLDVSRVSRGVIELRRRPLALAEVLRSAVEAARPLMDRRGHQLQLEWSDEPLVVDADPVRLTQVFANLLHNAAKYTDPGGRVTVTLERSGGNAVVRVRDNGIGIPPEVLPQVFDLFVQAPVSLDRAQGGLGIGLTMVRALTELHGGRVRAQSAGRGYGTTMEVQLPLSTQPVASRPAPAAEEPEVVAEARLRVLVVDDNRDAAESLSMMLRLMGHETKCELDGAAALDRATAWRPDLVVLDIGLPGIDGYEVARRLRALPHPPCRIVALTGYGSAEDRERSRTAGMDDHLVKPLAPETLRALLERTSAARRRPPTVDTTARS